MAGQIGSGKKTSKLERLLRQDHSDVYFDNERLTEELNDRLNNMQKEMHKHDIQRGIEIKKLRNEIRAARQRKAMTNHQSEHIDDDAAIRPHTSVGYSPRKKTGGPVRPPRAQSAWARSGPGDESDDDDDEEDADSDSSESRRPPAKPVRIESPDSSVSTLRNTKTLRKYKKIGGSCFKENNRFPEEWYVRCLPASDAAIYNARKKTRGKSAPVHSGFLGKIREREMAEKKFEQFAKMNQKAKAEAARKAELGYSSSNTSVDREGLTLVCDEPVKPIFMSRRRLREISNVENVVDRGPSRHTERHDSILNLNRLENMRILKKVRTFCVEIEELKAREIHQMKEREDARRREAQEREIAQSHKTVTDEIEQEEENVSR